MAVQSVFGSMGKFFSFSPLQMMIEVYCGIFGLLTIILEGRKYSITHSFHAYIRDYAKFLTFTWGRGIFYCFSGSLMFSQVTMIDMLIGGYMIVVGLTSIIVGRHTASKLTSLRHSLSSEKVVKQKFQEMDKDGSGYLDSAELANLCASLGSPLDHNELCASLQVIDADKNGQISYDEFFAWWSGWSYDKADADYDDVTSRAQFGV